LTFLSATFDRFHQVVEYLKLCLKGH